MTKFGPRSREKGTQASTYKMKASQQNADLPNITSPWRDNGEKWTITSTFVGRTSTDAISTVPFKRVATRGAPAKSAAYNAHKEPTQWTYIVSITAELEQQMQQRERAQYADLVRESVREPS